MISNRDKLETITRLNIVYLKNKFANEDPEIDEEIPIDQDSN